MLLVTTLALYAVSQRLSGTRKLAGAA
jgi:hypothetical protein